MSAMQMTDLALESDPCLPWFFLERLASLVVRQAAASPTERQALGLATFSVFLDCLDLGLVAQARELLGQLLEDDAGAEGAA